MVQPYVTNPAFLAPTFVFLNPNLATSILGWFLPDLAFLIFELESQEKKLPVQRGIKLSCSEPQRTLLSVELRSSSIFLRFPPALGDFPSFSVVFFLPFSCHSSIFLHLPPVFNELPSFSLVFSSLFPAGVNGPRGESKPTVTSLRSGTCPPKKVQFARPPLQLISSFRATRDDHPPDPLIFTSFAKTTLPSLSAGFRNKQHL